MNERIRVLAEQAREYANSKEPYEKIKNKAWIDVYDEKFAELIVEECLNIVGVGGEFCSRPKLVEKIKEHFGVEE